MNSTAIQVIPDLTTRFTYNSERLSLRFSSTFTTISGRVLDNSIKYDLGYLVSLAGKVSSFQGGDLYFSASTGKGTSHFMDTFNGKNTDLVFNPDVRRFESLSYWAAYLSYSHELPKNFSASAAIGASGFNNKNFQADIFFDNSYNALLNVFWDPVEGARLGMEYAHGKRVDRDGASGYSNRVSLLMYYDF